MLGGADVNQLAKGRYTPLMDACTYGSAACAATLIAKGADAAMQSSNGRTSLHYAAGYGHEGCARLLIEQVPQLAHIRDCKGLLPIDLAKKYNNLSMCAVLRRSGSGSSTRLVAETAVTAPTRPTPPSPPSDGSAAKRAKTS